MFERAWAAGFFDGEGCTTGYLTTNRIQRWRLTIAVTQIHLHTLQRFQDAVGGVGNIYGPYDRGDRSSQFTFKADGREAFDVLVLLWPHLAVVKQRQAVEAAERWAATMPQRTPLDERQRRHRDYQRDWQRRKRATIHV